MPVITTREPGTAEPGLLVIIHLSRVFLKLWMVPLSVHNGKAAQTNPQTLLWPLWPIAVKNHSDGEVACRRLNNGGGQSRASTIPIRIKLSTECAGGVAGGRTIESPQQSSSATRSKLALPWGLAALIPSHPTTLSLMPMGRASTTPHRCAKSWRLAEARPPVTLWSARKPLTSFLLLWPSCFIGQGVRQQLHPLVRGNAWLISEIASSGGDVEIVRCCQLCR